MYITEKLNVKTTNKKFLGKLLLSLLISTFTIFCFAEFAGGSGTENDPWQVETAEQLERVGNYLGDDNTDKFFMQTANIDLTDFLWDTGEDDYINDGAGWLPIGNKVNHFQGNYNGNNKTIHGLYIYLVEAEEFDEFHGLFGVVAGADISHVRLIDVDITAGTSSGSLVGSAIEKTTISNCYSTGEVRGDKVSGGLVGSLLQNSTMINCYSTANVSGDGSVGGLAGVNSNNSLIEQCFSSGDVEATTISAGGLVGVNEVDAVIKNSFSTSDVTCETMAAGLVGLNNYRARVVNCYSIGTVSGTPMLTSGLIGGNKEEATVENSYWNTETSGQNTSQGGEGRTTEQMTYPYDADTYVDWDFDEIWKPDEDHYHNDGYPYLRDTKFVSIDSDKPVPSDIISHSNYPNPFNPHTNIIFYLPRESEVLLEIYNVKGQKINTVYEGRLNAGEHRKVWDGKDKNGRETASGVYFSYLVTENKVTINKMIMVK